MNRYIYNIQYNKTDNKELIDTVWVDGFSQKEALRKLGKQFPGVYNKILIRTEFNYG